jgi:hypothetical protein
VPTKKKADIFDVLDQDRRQVENVTPQSGDTLIEQHGKTVLQSHSVEPKPEKLIQKAVYIRPDQDKELRRLVKQYNYEHDADINASHLVRFLLDRYGGDRLLADFFAEQEAKGK